MTHVSVKLAKEDAAMMATILRKLPRFKGKKDSVLVEALHIFYQNLEQVRWRQR